MASYASSNPADQAQALNEAIDRTLRAQEYQIRSERVRRPDLDKLIAATITLNKLANVSPGACSVGQIGCVTGGVNSHW